MYEIYGENDNELRGSLKELTVQLGKIKSIQLNEKDYEIEFFLASDYKMLRLLYGQKASNALEGCVWCKYSMGNKPNKNDNWPISKNLSLDEENQEVKPIIKFIDYKNCVVDLLHLLLRVTDQLYKLLFFKFARIDKNDGADVNLRPNLKIFLDFLKNKCKISNAFYISLKSTEKNKLRSLNRNERMRIFEELFKQLNN